MIFSRAFEDFGFDVRAMSAGYGLAESVVYVCDGGCSHETVSARRLECDLDRRVREVRLEGFKKV